MDKAKLCNIIRSKYPKIFGIRKILQRIKVKRLRNHFMAERDVLEGEQNPEREKEIIAPYLIRWKKNLKPIVREMEDIFQNAPAYKDRVDKDNLRTDMLFCRLAYGFLPSEYIGFELEGKKPAERKKFFSDLDTLVFGYTVNDIAQLQSIVDKGQSFEQFSSYFGRDAIVIEREKDFGKFQEFVKKYPIFVQKRTNSSMGKNIELVDIRIVKETEYEYFKKLISVQKHLLEERVVQHESMARFNPSSVNTIRCITFHTENGVEIPFCFMRTGRNGAFVDNGGSGGLLIGIDVATGVLNTDGFSEYNERFPIHPDTGIPFIGSKIPAWEDLIAFCKAAATKHKEVRYLSWDLAYTDNGWIVIEVNGIGQFIGPQVVTKCGIRASIQEYLSRMNKSI